MKNKYFGDINDFRKYGLLRGLARVTGARIGVCWLLTPDTPGSDGQKLSYLRNPGLFRRHDDQLFDFLGRSSGTLRSNGRALQALADSRIIPDAVFFDDYLPTRATERQDFFLRCKRQFQACDAIFFDPDNGLAPASVKLGQRGTDKYIFPHELKEFITSNNRSIIVYQHFPRVQREPFLKRTYRGICSSVGEIESVAYVTSHVAFVMCARNLPTMTNLQEAVSTWEGQIRLIEL